VTTSVKGTVTSTPSFIFTEAISHPSQSEVVDKPGSDETVSSSCQQFSSTTVEQRIAEALRRHCILFGQACDAYFAFLDNDFPSPLEFGGKNYKCATGAYEAQKFFHRSDLMDRFTTFEAREALAFSAEKHLEKHPSWYSKRETTMFHVLRAKFGQNPTLQHFLILTIDCYLSFHTRFKGMDPFWTDNTDGSGANRLGYLLMAIRKEYGGVGESARPTNYGQFIPQEETRDMIAALGKSDQEILAEIHDLNAKINDEQYELDSKHARRIENQAFTRFRFNNFPYDATLVPLSAGRYINASFVLGRDFIGTQSPMPNTVEDFWSMILEHDVSIVIMLNRLTDPGDYIYFPFSLNDKKTYGEIHLELIEAPFFKTDPSWRQSPHEEEPHAIIHRKVKIYRKRQDGEHLIHHFQYQNWRDFSAGNERAAAYLVKAVNGYCDGKPIVIHCHAGVGRTSAMITLLDQARYLSSGNIDVKRSVERQRSPQEGRCHSMMQSPDQYLFCYRTLDVMRKQEEHPFEPF
jgi:protein tyrosine phosphatase/predicted NAD-dependent protein-ADP-ribosyltransferase YbiA (DUF1768 family)